MLTLDITPGGSEANAYVSLECAEEYISSLRFCEEWTAADDEKKTAAIVQAARWMDSMRWKGERATESQALAWPRCFVSDSGGFEVPSTIIPRRVMEANAEFAFRLLVKDRADDAKRGVAIGPVRTFDKSRQLVPSSVVDLVRAYLIPADSIQVVRS